MRDLLPADKFAKLPERYQRRAREIAARVSEIDSLCRSASVSEIGDSIKRMRRQFRPQPDTEDREMTAGFRDACSDLPAWALSEAANDFLAGRVENHTGQFMPTCAEFAKHARSVVLPFMAERSSLRVEASKLVERAEDDHRRHLIDIERQDPAVRQRVAELAEDFAAGAPKRQSVTHLGLSEQQQSRLDALKKPRSFTSKIGHEAQKKEG